MPFYFALIQCQYKMTHHNTLNIKLFNSQLSKLKSRINNCIELTLNFLSIVIGYSNDETNYPHKLLLTDKFQSFVKLLRISHQLI